MCQAIGVISRCEWGYRQCLKQETNYRRVWKNVRVELDIQELQTESMYSLKM